MKRRFRVILKNGKFKLKPEKNFYKMPDVAEIFAVAERTVERWIFEGKLKAIKPGGRHYLIAKKTVLALLNRSMDELR